MRIKSIEYRCVLRRQRTAATTALIWVVAIFSLFTLHFSLLSCTQDTYDKGDGTYSNMRGDFAEAWVGADRKIVSFTTDDGETFPLTQPYTAKWITSADTVYRCMLYYNKVRDSKGMLVAEPISIGDVPCPKVVPLSKLETAMKTDPVNFESVWVSRTGKYLNLSFTVMTGTREGNETSQRLSIVEDTVTMHADATRTSYLRLYHDQAGVPEYYSSQVYASVLTSQIPADSVCIIINTYKGTVTKTLPLRKP